MRAGAGSGGSPARAAGNKEIPWEGCGAQVTQKVLSVSLLTFLGAEERRSRGFPGTLRRWVTWRLEVPVCSSRSRGGAEGRAPAGLCLWKGLCWLGMFTLGTAVGAKHTRNVSFKLQRPGWANARFPGGLIRCPMAVLTAGDSARGR